MDTLTKTDGAVDCKVIHNVPGRVRIGFTKLINNPGLCSTVEQSLRGQHGISRASANPVTGNVVITYDKSLSADEVTRLVSDCLNPKQGGMITKSIEWWKLDASDLLTRMTISPLAGLSDDDVQTRRARYGANVLAAVQQESDFERVIRQFQSLPVALLCGSAVISLLTGGIVDAALVGGVVATNVVIGFVTERKAENIIGAYIRHDRPNALVRRNGGITEIAAEDLVPGDILVLAPGQILTTDARLLTAHDLATDESMLTGESAWVEKNADPVYGDTLLAERSNMVFAGTTVVAGRGLAVVVATGNATEIGRIGMVIDETKQRETPMQRQLGRIGSQLTWISVLCAGGMFGLGFLRGVPLGSLLRTTTALAVAAIPEGLPAVATSILATGLREMQRNDVLIRRLDAVETLGSVSVICFDKTGTLTQNKMAATRFVLPVEDMDPMFTANILTLLTVGVLCNESSMEAGKQNHVINGSSTENALLMAAIEGGLDVNRVRGEFPLIETVGRTQTRSYMKTIHQEADGVLVAVKGNPVDVLGMCNRVYGSLDLNHAQRDRILAANRDLSGAGLRVLGFAIARGHTSEDATEYTWLGMVGLSDPIRPSMPLLIEHFHDAGIRTVMITGDQSGTASAIADQVRLAEPVASVDARILREVDSDDQLVEMVRNTSVFARFSPIDKLSVIHGLQAANEVVAMIGDGANDGPALRASDIGVSFGVAGTDAARETADVILGKDDLETMIVAVQHGRSIYANIRKAIHFLVGTNSSEVMVTLAGSVVGNGPTLNAAQLLWMNVITDTAVAFGLGLEQPEADVLQYPPRPRDEPIIAVGDYGRLLMKGGLYSATSLMTHLYGIARYGSGGGGVGFTTLVASQLLDGFSSRSERRAAWDMPSNPHLNKAVFGMGALQGLVSLFPTTRSMFGLAAFDLLDLAVIGVGAVVPFLLIESRKSLRADQAPVPERRRVTHQPVAAQ